MTSVTVDTSITFGDLVQIGQSGPAMYLYDSFVAETQYFSINFDDLLKYNPYGYSGSYISGYYDEFSIRGADNTIYYSIAFSGGIFHNKSDFNYPDPLPEDAEIVTSSTIFKVNAPDVTEIKLSWSPPYHPWGVEYMWNGNTTITFWKMLSSVPTSDISAHPTMFEIDMRSSVPSDSHQDYITNDSITHNDAEQAGDFTTDGGLTTNLDNLLGDSPDAITVICKFKNNAADTKGVLFHIGATDTNKAFGIDIQSTVVYLYTWNDDNKYETSTLNLRTQWNEMIAIFDENKTDPDRLILYLNGVKQTALDGIPLDGTTHNYASSPYIDLSSNKNLYVGQRHNSTYWSGYMKHIQIFPKVVYGLIKIKVKLRTSAMVGQSQFYYAPLASGSWGPVSNMTTVIQEWYFKLTLKNNIWHTNTPTMSVVDAGSQTIISSTLSSTQGGEEQGSFNSTDSSYNTITNSNYKLVTNFDIQTSNYDTNETYAILTFHRELIEEDINRKSSGATFTIGQITPNLYQKHTHTVSINSNKIRLVFKNFILDSYTTRFKERLILKYKNAAGKDTWVQYGTPSILVDDQWEKMIKYITYDNEDDAYSLTNAHDTVELGLATNIPSTNHLIDISATEKDIEMIFLAYHDRFFPSRQLEIDILEEDVFSSSVDPPLITPNVQDLTNAIDLSVFIGSSTVFNWSDYKIKFTSDGNEQLFDMVPDTTTTPTPTTTFILNMPLKQLKHDVTCKFDIIYDNSDVHTSSNFTLAKQNVTASNFELSLLSSAATPSILFQNNSQWIYMHEHSGLDQTFIHYKADVISQTNADYHPFFMHGDTYSSESQYVDNSGTQKIKLRLTLNNKKISGDTLSLTDTTEFIIHNVSFNDFHTPTINPRSNINYFKEKKFRFTVSNPNYSFTFEENTYEKTFKSGGTYSMTNINNRYNIIINNSADDNLEEALDIMPYKFIDGPNTLTFKIINTLSGVQNIYTTSIFEKSTNKSISIDLNVESDAIISCTPS